MSHALLQQITDVYKKKDFPEFRVGDQVSVSVRIKEGNKERIQKFQGVVIAYQKKGSLAANFTVRKIASGVGVERTFPLHSPFIEAIEVKTFGKVRRSKLFYLRDLSAKEARIKPDTKRENRRRTARNEEKQRARQQAQQQAAAVAPEPVADGEAAVSAE